MYLYLSVCVEQQVAEQRQHLLVDDTLRLMHQLKQRRDQVFCYKEVLNAPNVLDTTEKSCRGLEGTRRTSYKVV